LASLSFTIGMDVAAVHDTASIYRRYSIVDQAMLDVRASQPDRLQQAHSWSDAQ
jgi:hypothetical protein